MTIIVRRDAMRSHSPPSEGRSATKPPDWPVSGPLVRKRCLIGQKHEPSSGSSLRSYRSQDKRDLDPEHPLRGPHPTD